MKHSMPVTILIGSALVAGGLVYHAWSLKGVSTEVGKMRAQSAELDASLDKFSAELPKIIEEAGRGAGKQAVRGIFEEAFDLPMRMALEQFRQLTTNAYDAPDAAIGPEAASHGASARPARAAETSSGNAVLLQNARRTQSSHAAPVQSGPARPVAPFFHLEIVEPDVHIEVNTSLDELPAFPFARGSKKGSKGTGDAPAKQDEDQAAVSPPGE